MALEVHNSYNIILSRLLWAGPLTILASVAAVLCVRVVAVGILHPAARFAPLHLAPPIIGRLVTADAPVKTRIAGWWLPARNPVGSVVMVHGGGENKSDMLGRAVVFVESGLNVAVIDLRARGESGGDKSDIGPGAALDVLAVVDALVASGRQGRLPLLGYGLSHGARAVVLAAARSPTAFSAVLAEAPPFSLRDSLKRLTGSPWVPALPEGDLPGAFATIKGHPVLLLLGDADPEISEMQGAALLSDNNNPASGVVVFEKTGHGVFRDSNLAQYRQSVGTFLKAVLKL